MRFGRTWLPVCGPARTPVVDVVVVRAEPTVVVVVVPAVPDFDSRAHCGVVVAAGTGPGGRRCRRRRDRRSRSGRSGGRRRRSGRSLGRRNLGRGIADLAVRRRHRRARDRWGCRARRAGTATLRRRQPGSRPTALQARHWRRPTSPWTRASTTSSRSCPIRRSRRSSARRWRGSCRWHRGDPKLA